MMKLSAGLLLLTSLSVTDAQVVSMSTVRVDPEAGVQIAFNDVVTPDVDKLWFQSDQEPMCDPYIDEGLRTNIRRSTTLGQPIQFDFSKLTGDGEKTMRLCRFTYAGIIDHKSTLLEVNRKGGFNFEGCGGGSGTFELTLPKRGDNVNVGTIPKDKVGVEVTLNAGTVDLDIRLFDSGVPDDKNEEGYAIVKWCRGSTCGEGLISSSAPKSEIYREMNVSYSGFNGRYIPEEDRYIRGEEFIKLSGTTPDPLIMQAWAWGTGSANVDYSWTDTVSACCRRTALCTGLFTQDVKKRAVVSLGVIPAGKLNLRIELKSDVDVDIQLYDLEPEGEDKEKYPLGKAIIAYCFSSDKQCNPGYKTAEPGSVLYKKLNYTYSGFNGRFNEDPDKYSKGDEWIFIAGETNTPLKFKVFGFQAGQSEVTYSYMEPEP